MRVRELRSGVGQRLRLALEADAQGGHPLVRLSLADDRAGAVVLLDGYGADLLSGFLMSARLAGDGLLPDEVAAGDYRVRMMLVGAGDGLRAIRLEQDEETLVLAQPFWDRLFAELLLMRAHGRGLASPGLATGHRAIPASRLIH